MESGGGTADSARVRLAVAAFVGVLVALGLWAWQLSPPFAALAPYRVAAAADLAAPLGPAQGRYTARLTRPQAEPAILFLPYHGGFAGAALDGTALSFTAVQQGFWIDRYRRFDAARIPAVPHQQEAVIVRIALSGDRTGSGAGPVYVGPERVIGPVLGQQRARVAAVNQALPVAAQMCLLVTLLLIFISRAPARYFYLLGTFACQILIESDLSMAVLGFGLRPFESYLGTVSLFFIYATLSTWWNRPAAERTAALAIMAGVLVLLALVDLGFGREAPATVVARVLLFAVPALAVVVQWFRFGLISLRHADMAELPILTSGTLAMVAIAANLVRLYLPMIAPDPPVLAMFWLYYFTKLAGVLALVGIALASLAFEYRKYAARHQTIRALGAIASGHSQALEEQSRALQAEIARRAVLEERERFTRDLHDGLSGQLFSLLIKARLGRLDPAAAERDISQCLADLRLVSMSLDGSDLSFAQGLAAFRQRIAPQVQTAGMALKWEECGTLDALWLDPRQSLDLFRAMQEVVTNAIRHSAARTLSVEIRGATPTHILLRDDGCGLPADDTARSGRGLPNIRARLERIGGAVVFAASPSGRGTCVTLTVPTVLGPLSPSG